MYQVVALCVICTSSFPRLIRIGPALLNQALDVDHALTTDCTDKAPESNNIEQGALRLQSL